MPRVTIDDGAEINYQVDDLTPKWFGEPDTILMVHRHAENLHFLTPLVPPLAAKYRVVRMDMRGRGDSTAPPGGPTLSGGPDESTLFQRQAKDAVALMDHLGIQKFHYLGAGGGAATGMIAAMEYPEHIKGLILVAMSCRLADDAIESWRQGEKDIATAVNKYGASEWIERALWPKILDKSKADPRFAAWNLAQRKKLSESILISIFQGAEVLDLCGRLGAIKATTLLITEEFNKFVHLEQVRFIQQNIPNAKLIIYEGMELGAHTVTADRCVKDVLEFLQSL